MFTSLPQQAVARRSLTVLATTAAPGQDNSSPLGFGAVCSQPNSGKQVVLERSITIAKVEGGFLLLLRPDLCRSVRAAGEGFLVPAGCCVH